MNFIGIDIGTSLSSVGIFQEGKAVPLRVETGTGSLLGDSFSIPSSIFVEEDGEILLGQAAEYNKPKNLSSYRKEFKRDLGTTSPYFLGSIEILPEEIYKEFFKYFKEKAGEMQGERIEKAVVAHPAHFGVYKKELIKKAAKLAGFVEVELIDEPTAAAIFYSSKEKINMGEKILIYDLGGGTFDVSLVEKEEKGFKSRSNPLGIERCGGVDFQKKIYDDMMETFKEELKQMLCKNDVLGKQTRMQFEAESIKIKHQLSVTTKAECVISIPGTEEYRKYSLTREKFDDMIQDYIYNTCLKVEEILKNAGVKKDEVDRVLLVGGSSRIPYVEKMLEKTIGKKVNKDADTELIVCLGAALAGNLYFNSKNPVKEVKEKKPELQEDKKRKLYKIETKSCEEKEAYEVEEEENSYQKKGNEFYETGDFEKAIEIYDKGIWRDGDKWELYYCKALALECLEKYESAISCYNRVTELDNKNGFAYGNKGQIYLKLKNYSEAIKCFNKLLELGSDDLELMTIGYYSKAKALEELGELEKAIQCYNNVIEMNKENAKAYNNKGAILFKLERYEEAVICCDKAIKADPEYTSAYNNKGVALYKLRRYKDAIWCYNKVLEMEPKNIQAMENKRIALKKLI